MAHDTTIKSAVIARAVGLKQSRCDGFSIPEILVVCVIMAIVAVGVAHLLTMQSTGTRQLSERTVANDQLDLLFNAAMLEYNARLTAFTGGPVPVSLTPSTAASQPNQCNDFAVWQRSATGFNVLEQVTFSTRCDGPPLPRQAQSLVPEMRCPNNFPRVVVTRRSATGTVLNERSFPPPGMTASGIIFCFRATTTENNEIIARGVILHGNPTKRIARSGILVADGRSPTIEIRR